MLCFFVFSQFVSIEYIQRLRAVVLRMKRTSQPDPRCVVWLLDPAFLMLRVRIENDSNSNSNQVLLNIYQVNILLSP